MTRNGADRTPQDVTGPSSDATLMAEMVAANGDALATLLHRYSRLVYRIAVDILDDPGEAEDVTQEVFLEVYCRAHLYDPTRGSVRCWLLQYAYHRTFRRKAALRTRAAYRSEPLDDRRTSDGFRVRHLTREEGRWIIRAGLERLPARQRTTLELVCFEGLGLRDIANRLGVSLGAARHYYYRGLAHLQAWARSDSSCPSQRPHDLLCPLVDRAIAATKQTIELVP